MSKDNLLEHLIELIKPLAQVPANLGSEAAWVVHGADGMDEITTTDITYVAALSDGKVKTFEISPEDAGISRSSPNDLRGGDSKYNAAAIQALLNGQDGPYRDIGLLNAAASLIVAGKVNDLKRGVSIAAQSIDGGAARKTLEKMIKITNSEY